MYEDLIKRLREKQSRDNRGLLDEAAGVIERLTANVEMDEDELAKLILSSCERPFSGHLLAYEARDLAEHLIANGVVIQKQGEWICTETYPWGDVYSCSKCGFEMDEELRTDYCPNCGAKMK